MRDGEDLSHITGGDWWATGHDESCARYSRLRCGIVVSPLRQIAVFVFFKKVDTCDSNDTRVPKYCRRAEMLHDDLMRAQGDLLCLHVRAYSLALVSLRAMHLALALSCVQHTLRKFSAIPVHRRRRCGGAGGAGRRG